MKPLSPELLNAYTKALGPLAATPAERGQSQKWLRYYLDFCMKYRHPPRDPDSLEPFLQKLASINQPVAYQEQAARCVSVYYEAVKNWDAVHAGPPAPLSTSSLRLSILSYSSRKNAACSRAKTASLGNVSSFSTRAPLLVRQFVPYRPYVPVHVPRALCAARTIIACLLRFKTCRKGRLG